MLNGKFYTGLPPNMIDRGSGGGRNRMESHLFWPDDTKVDTAVESRIKRRNSVQLAYTERPEYVKQNTAVDDVDTRKRFSKEFSQSSIQFYDNLNDNNTNSRRSMLRNSIANKKNDITEKPTNTKQQLPDNMVNEAYTAAKKKQAYTSKIEFYDFDNDREEFRNERNNLRKPKMDMNDKREMELNSKNSPKLQIKRDVRSLSEEKELRKINNREVRTMERPARNNRSDNEGNYLRSRRSVEPRMNHSPKRSLTNSINSRQQRYSNEREIYREPLPLPYDRSNPLYYGNYERNARNPTFFESERFTPREYEDFDDASSYRGGREEPRTMIRNNTKQYNDAADDGDYSHEYITDRDMRSKMRDIHLSSPPPSSVRKQYYPTAEYYDDEPQYNYCQNDQLKTPTNRGSSNHRFDFSNRQDSEIDLPNKDYNNMPNKFGAGKPAINKISNQLVQETVASPTSPSPLSDVESSVSATKSQKHLRSSLCFNNGEIIGANDAVASPTSSKHQAQRRNARSSATQRVSVGLPD